jgi:hypothetical protein
MKHLAIVAAVLIFAGGVSAGPNEGIVLAVHGGRVEAITTSTPTVPLPPHPHELIPTSTPDREGVEWFTIVAVSPPENTPDFLVVIFGVGDYDPNVCEIEFFQPAHPGRFTLEIPSDGWPGPFSGTAVAFGEVDCLTGHMEPVYYLGVYATGPSEIPLGDYYPHQKASVATCGPGRIFEDPFKAFGTIGCGGERGENIIPWVGQIPQDPVPVERTTWGRIKSVYR